MWNPVHLTIPPTGKLLVPAVVQLNYGDLGTWEDVAVVALHASHLSDVIFLDPMSSSIDVEAAVLALKEGHIPQAEVPRLIVRSTEPELVSKISLLHALFQLGHLQLPLLTDKSGAAWLSANWGATGMPSSWQLK